MRNVSDKSCRENQNTLLCSVTFDFYENRASYEIILEYVVGSDRPQLTIFRMRLACWITKVMDTHSEYVILIALPQQQWLRERASELHLYLRTLSVLLISVMCEMRSVPRSGYFSPMKSTNAIGG